MLLHLTKRIIFVVLCLLLLLVTALWIAGQKVLNSYKPEIEKRLSAASGVQVKIEALRLTLLPAPVLKAQQVSLQPPVDPASRPLPPCAPLASGKIVIRLRWSGLLRGELAIKALDLSDFQATLKKGAAGLIPVTSDGRECSFRQSPRAVGDPGDQPVPSPAAGKHADLLVLKLFKVNLKSGVLRLFTDRQLHLIELNSLSAAVQRSGEQGAENKLSILEIIDFAALLTYANVPLKIAAEKLSFDFSSLHLSLDQGQVSSPASELGLSGAWNFSSRAAQFRLDAPRVGLKEVLTLLGEKKTSRRIKSGALAIAAGGRLHGQQIAFEGRTKVTNLQLEDGSLNTRSLTLDKVALDLAGGLPAAGSANFSLEGFYIRDTPQHYSAERAAGTVSYKANRGHDFKGALSVEDFAYRDEETRIGKVNARLDDIAARYTKAGGVTVKFNLDGNSIRLDNPSIIINSVARVKAPLTVSVPAAGGYSVAGPVDAAEGELLLLQRRLQRVSGRVDMLVSSGLKDFRSTRISAVSFDQNVQGSAHFWMTPELYGLNETELTLGGGKVTASGTLSRKNGKAFTLSANVRELPLEGAYHALMQQEKDAWEGSISELSASLAGERQTLSESLTGEGAFQFKKTAYHGFDLLAAIKSALTSIPVAGGLLVPAGSLEEGRAGDLRGIFKVARQRVHISRIEAPRANFTLKGEVYAGFDRKLEGQATVVFFEQSFRSLGLGFDSLARVLGAGGQVAVPLVVGGTIDNPSFTPDVGKIVKKASGLGLAQSMLRGAAKAGDQLADTVR